MSHLRTVAAAVTSGLLPSDHAALPMGDSEEQRPPFITLSRQAGAGATSLMHRLVERLQTIDPDPTPWEGYDRELVEKVANEHQLSQSLIEGLEERDQSWITELLSGLDPKAFTQSETAIERRVAQTIRGLAQRGRCVIVGRGGVFITRHLPQGVHVHLVATLADRVRHMARVRGISEDQAAQEIERIERNRTAFYRRHFPTQSLGPETFTLTLNTSLLNEDQLVDAILAVLPLKTGAASATTPTFATAAAA